MTRKKSLFTTPTVTVLVWLGKRLSGVINCTGKEAFLAQCAHLCRHEICNEGHVFVHREYIEDWSVVSTLSSVSHEGNTYFLVKWGHDLLLQTIIGPRQNFGSPSGQNSIFPFRAGERDDGISTLCSHQYHMISLWTRGSLEKSNVKPSPITDSPHVTTKSSWEGTRDTLCPNRQSVSWQGLLGWHTDHNMYSTFLIVSPGSILFSRSNLLKRKDLCLSWLRVVLIRYRRSLRSSLLFSSVCHVFRVTH